MALAGNFNSKGTENGGLKTFPPNFTLEIRTCISGIFLSTFVSFALGLHFGWISSATTERLVISYGMHFSLVKTLQSPFQITELLLLIRDCCNESATLLGN